MSKTAAIVTFKAQAGKGNEVARLIGDALPEATAEHPMPLWLVLQSETDADTVYIVDVFVDAAGRDAHLAAPTATRIIAAVSEHLAAPIDIAGMKLISAKGV
jgi:quinol monooxygenase YgiN